MLAIEAEVSSPSEALYSGRHDQKLMPRSVDEGFRAIRWTGPGTTAIELGNLGTNTSGFTNSFIFAVSGAGDAFGEAQKYLDESKIKSDGTRPVRGLVGTAEAEHGALGRETIWACRRTLSDVTNQHDRNCWSATFIFDSARVHRIRAVLEQLWQKADIKGPKTALGSGPLFALALRSRRRHRPWRRQQVRLRGAYLGTDPPLDADWESTRRPNADPRQ